MRTVLLVATACVAVLAAGCGDGPPSKPDGVAVRGKALLPNGSPLSGGVLTFRPVGGIHGASAAIQKDGTFTLADPSGDSTVVPGKYLVYVRFNDAGEKALRAAVNKRYQDTEDGDSDVAVEVTEARNDLVVRFKR